MSTTEGIYDLITRNLQEVLGGDTIKNLLIEGKNPKCYWGERSDVTGLPISLILTYGLSDYT
jgi:hypothetical protein